MNVRGPQNAEPAQSGAPTSTEPLTDARDACAALKRWLLEHAYPLWWERGADRVRGGYHEKLSMAGVALENPRRARLHPRQICSFGIAQELGWSGPHDVAIRQGLDFFLAHYLRPDGVYRELVAPDGATLSDRAVLYDQAFALSGLAAAYAALREDDLRDRARDLHARLRAQFAHPLSGFEESHPRSLPLLSNSHMHLFEAALAWSELDDEPIWRALAAEIVELALTCFIDPQHGCIREFFDPDWRAVPGVEGRIAEPGHQFEWAWLLLCWSRRTQDERAAAAAVRLIEFGECFGIDASHDVAVNTLLTDGTIHDARARLWPQTERIKAACIAAEFTGQLQYWQMAARAARGLLRYFDTPLRGLWYDTLTPDGAFIDEPAPASSFYHITLAIAELERTLRRAPQLSRVSLATARLPGSDQV